MIILKVRTLL